MRCVYVLNTSSPELKVSKRNQTILFFSKKKKISFRFILVLIYGAMDLFEEAVDLAIEIEDLELAKKFAEKPDDDDQLKKRLWLRIAKHVVTGEGNIKKGNSRCSLF